MKKKIVLSALSKLMLGAVLLSVFLFVPAGTLYYPGALIFFAVLFVPMIICGVFLAVRHPKLLEKRLRTEEKQSGQKSVITMSILMFCGGFLSAGVCFRNGFLILPLWISVAASVVFVIGYILYFIVLGQNEYLSRVIEVSEGQRVIDTGLYSVIRHPMYLATVLMFTAIGFMLMSAISAVIFCAYPFIIAQRIKHEERFLEEELPGYREYMERVRYRLIPKIY